MTEATKTPLEMFYQWERQTPHSVFLRQPHNLQWTEYTWSMVADAVRRVASFLQSKGYPPGSSIALWSANSRDFVIADLAIMMAGHVSVPLYPGQDSATARYILDHSEARLCFVGSVENSERIDGCIPEGVELVGLMACPIQLELTLDQILIDCTPLLESPIPDPESLLTLVYTSGTTGSPKGVMHVHATPGRVVPELAVTAKQVSGDCRLFSYLPMAHIAERIVIEMMALYMGGSISFSEGQATFLDELRSVQPTFFFSVPRLWTKFKEGIDAKVPAAAQRSLPETHKAGIRQMLGLANARFILTGSAPCPTDVQQAFIDLGIWVRDGYGMTENLIHGCGWVQDGPPVPGCVGKGISPSVQVRLGENDEVQFNSPALMKGYYKEPEKTAEVLVGGWYRTGDIGRFDEDGNLWLTGRLSEVFKTSKGKFVKPGALEDMLCNCALLSQICVIGHGLDQPVVLASLSESGKRLDRDELKKTLATHLETTNEQLPNYERLKQIFVTRDEWTISNNLLTPTMKLKRKTVEEQFRPWVQSLLGQDLVVFE
jgi:long-chain acyl-CoA synthetase